MRGPLWSGEHVAYVKREWPKGTPTAEMAAHVGREPHQVRKLATRLGLRRPPPGPDSASVLRRTQPQRAAAALEEERRTLVADALRSKTPLEVAWGGAA